VENCIIIQIIDEKIARDETTSSDEFSISGFNDWVQLDSIVLRVKGKNSVEIEGSHQYLGPGID